MELHDTFTWAGQTVPIVYHDADDFSGLLSADCRQVYGVCFCGGKIIIGQRRKNNAWGIIGGTIEPGETYLQTLTREIKEESNMRVLVAVPVGYQIMHEPTKTITQLRYAAVVEPIGPFVADPDGSIIAIQLIDPARYRDYFDWGPIGDRIMQRSCELYLTQLQSYDHHPVS